MEFVRLQEGLRVRLEGDNKRRSPPATAALSHFAALPWQQAHDRY